jgi:hypothetical protein
MEDIESPINTSVSIWETITPQRLHAVAAGIAVAKAVLDADALAQISMNTIPLPLQGHLSDFMLPAVVAAMYITAINDRNAWRAAIVGTAFCGFIEGLQGLHMIKGTGDWFDIPFYAIGGMVTGLHLTLWNGVCDHVLAPAGKLAKTLFR